MTKNLHPFQRNFVTLAGEIAESLSFNRSIGQLFGLLYISAHPLSLEELAKGCHMSKGNASLHLRTLESWGAVQRSWKPGIRKDYYTATLELKGLAIKRLHEGVSKRLGHARERLEGFKNGPSFTDYLTHSGGNHAKKRLQEAEALMDQVEIGLSLLPRFFELKKLLPFSLGLRKRGSSQNDLKSAAGPFSAFVRPSRWVSRPGPGHFSPRGR